MTALENQLFDRIREHLTEDDDPALWEAVLSQLLADAQLRAQCKTERWPIQIEIGACSHWAAPHQWRTTAGGGFAAPKGYGEGGTGKGRIGAKSLPQFDWSLLMQLNEESHEWDFPRRSKSKRFLCRAAVPTRSNRHAQASVNVTWIPHPPEERELKMIRCADLYGFRKVNDSWQCVVAPEFTLGDDDES